MFGRLLGCYIIYTFQGLLPLNGILPNAKFTLRPSLTFSYICSVTARHLSSGRQPNFAAFSTGRHLYSVGRLSRWALTHIAVQKCFSLIARQILMATLKCMSGEWRTKYRKTRMWANAQRDGRPAEHRWRPLFNATVWLTPTT